MNFIRMKYSVAQDLLKEIDDCDVGGENYTLFTAKYWRELRVFETNIIAALKNLVAANV